MIVVDASVAVDALVFANPEVLTALARADVHAPHLLDVEVAHVVRRLARGGAIDADAGRSVLRDLAELPIERHPHHPFLDRIWALRDNLSAYDATYVALAEGLGATLLTRDGRLSRAPGIRAAVRVVG